VNNGLCLETVYPKLDHQNENLHLLFPFPFLVIFSSISRILFHFIYSLSFHKYSFISYILFHFLYSLSFHIFSFISYILFHFLYSLLFLIFFFFFAFKFLKFFSCPSIIFHFSEISSYISVILSF